MKQGEIKMQITEARLRQIIRQELIKEVGGSDYADDRTLAALSNPAARKGMGIVLNKAGEAGIDFGKGLIQLLGDTFLYFKTGQQYIDAVRGLTGKDVTPKDQAAWRAQIAAAGLHDFLDKFGTAGLDLADVVNGFLYMGEKNWKMAGLCMIAAVPVVGGAVVASKGTGKFAIKATEQAALDAGIENVKQGLKASGVAGADEVIKEVEKIRADMNGAKADFKPYEQIPASQTQAVQEVVKDPSRLKKAYDDLIERVSADPKKYEDADEYDPKDYPDERFGIVPEFLTPGREALGREMLDVWSRHADHNFFDQVVKKVHWLGFSSKENRTALQALSDFLNNAPKNRASQISAVGYVEDLNPGPRAGASFRTSPQDRQLQVGIKLRGDVKYATSGDAFTTNPRGKGRQNPGKFEKIPRVQTSTLGSLVMSNPKLYPELYAELQKDIAATGRYTDPKWMETAAIIPAPSAGSLDTELMLDKATWREPYTDAAIHNEVVLDKWEPEAVILNTSTASTEEIMQFKELADSYGLPLLDTDGAEIKMSDYQRTDRAHVPNKTGASRIYDIKSQYSTYDPKTRTRKYGGVKYEPSETPYADDRTRLYEGHVFDEDRWVQLAGMLKGTETADGHK